jgi:cytochrome c553
MKRFLLLSIAICFATTFEVSAEGDAAAGKAKSATCAGCHGVDGNSTNPEWPKLAGQHPKYLIKELNEFKAGKTRRNASMAAMVANLSEQDMEDLAAYFAAQPATGGYTEQRYVELGEQIYRGGKAVAGMAACMSCHGPSAEGNPLMRVPTMAGQHANYTANQLRAFRSGERYNDPYGIMRTVAKRMTDEEIEAVSHYVAALQ